MTNRSACQYTPRGSFYTLPGVWYKGFNVTTVVMTQAPHVSSGTTGARDPRPVPGDGGLYGCRYTDYLECEGTATQIRDALVLLILSVILVCLACAGYGMCCKKRDPHEHSIDDASEVTDRKLEDGGRAQASMVPEIGMGTVGMPGRIDNASHVTEEEEVQESAASKKALEVGWSHRSHMHCGPWATPQPLTFFPLAG